MIFRFNSTVLVPCTYMYIKLHVRYWMNISKVSFDECQMKISHKKIIEHRIIVKVFYTINIVFIRIHL